jgi:hypothetical protein
VSEIAHTSTRPHEKVLYLTVAVAFDSVAEEICRNGSGPAGDVLAATLMHAIREQITDHGVIRSCRGRLIGKATLVADPSQPITANPQGDPQ